MISTTTIARIAHTKGLDMFPTTGTPVEMFPHTDGIMDMFELVPVNPYTDADLDWTDRSSRVCTEHDYKSLQDIELESTEVPDWSAYDTVLFGYPLWWREAAWPVNTFVKGNDFAGKTVIPFCTSTSNGFGDSGKLLEEMAGTGDWVDGMRFSEREDEEKIREALI